MAVFQSWRSALDPERVMSVTVTRWQEQSAEQREDQVTVEEPFEVRIAGRSLAVIMRTPGHDHELAAGFLFTEGIIHAPTDILKIEDAADEERLPLANVVDVTLRQELAEAACAVPPGSTTTAFERHFAVSSSCGLCGKNSIADLMVSTPPLESDNLQIPVHHLYTLPDRLREAQDVFTHTGGLHAAGLFDLAGQLLLSREDIGRHNAVDKIIGRGLLDKQLPYREAILMVSGRTSFEIIQKALLARIPCIVSISAPSSLAVELAERGGITLVGFLRNQRMNVYTHPERISVPA